MTISLSNMHKYRHANIVFHQSYISILSNELIRSCSSVNTQPKATKPLPRAPLREIDKTKGNWVRPPDPVSNLRLIDYKETPNDTEYEKLLRAKQVDVQNWNHQFWTSHNSKFYKEKTEFIVEKKKELNKNEKNATISPDEMSKFYKQFLDDNYKEHIHYNR
ncbi:Apoptogenic protein 1, mitochondrial, variant 2 [Chamberlinius hualienensis]